MAKSILDKIYNGADEFELARHGLFGFDVIDVAAGQTTGEWLEIKAIDGDATLSAEAWDMVVCGDDLPSVTLKEGDTIPGAFKSITVTAGKVLAYRAGPQS